MNQEISKDGTVKTTSNEFSGREVKEFKCPVCHAWNVADDVVWAKDDGTLSTTDDHAKPYCVDCVPENNLDLHRN